MRGSSRKHTPPPRRNTRRPAKSAAAAVAVAALAVPGYRYASDHHIGAPPPDVTCQPPDHLVTSWYHGSTAAVTGPGGGTPAGEVHWLGWTEVGGCGESVTVQVGANP